MTALLIAAALVFTPGDARLALETAHTLVTDHTPRDGGTVRGKTAAKFLAEAATRAGVKARLDEFTLSEPRTTSYANVFAEFPGKNSDDGWIVIVSHYDTKVGIACPGANDGASTSGLLVGLAAALARTTLPEPRTTNILLLWTDGEECVREYGPQDGLHGSRHAAAQLAREGRKIKAVICVDMLGDADLLITIPANGDRQLAQLALSVAKKVNGEEWIQLSSVHVLDDHVPFWERGFPAIDLIDFSYGPNNSYWHTAKDTMDKLSEQSLLKSGQLLVGLINSLSMPNRRRGILSASDADKRPRLRTPNHVSRSANHASRTPNHASRTTNHAS